MQLDLLAGALANDFARMTAIRDKHSVGGANWRRLGIDEGRRRRSHEPDSNEAARKKRFDVDRRDCGETADLAQ